MTGKEQLWLEEYLVCWNATEAARRAGYKWPDKVGSQVKERLSNEISKAIEARAMSSDEVLLRLAEQARGGHAPYIKESGEVDIEKLVRDGKAHLIKSVKPTRYGMIYEFYDSQAAQVHLGRHHALFTDKAVIDLSAELLDLIRSKQFTPEQIRVMFPDVALPVVGIEA